MADPQFFEVRNRHIPDREAAQLFIDADIVVLPYVEASQSGVLAIANAFAKPVIVTDVGELGRAVEDGVSGLVVPPADERPLADAILKLATDGALRARDLGMRGTRRQTGRRRQRSSPKKPSQFTRRLSVRGMAGGCAVNLRCEGSG